MSTSLIYHGFGTVGYNYLKMEYREGRIFIHIEKKPEYQYCADCKAKRQRSYERKKKRVQRAKARARG